MKRLHLNLNARAWRNMRRAWRPAPMPGLLWQSFVVGPLLSAVYSLQLRMTAPARKSAKLDGALIVLGYWRSGTTLLHELLAASGRWSVPTTHACMNPQSFALAPPSAHPAAAVRRPMDDMVIGPDSPQEGEFALLGLGARSPYEALLFPGRLAEALELADPEELSQEERLYWRDTLRSFLCNVVAAQGGKPLVLKSPTHSCRIAALRSILPGCRFAVVVRDPYLVFESAVRMWHEMFARYALTPIPSDDEVRATLLAHRPGFERKLKAGLDRLAPSEYTVVRFEDLTARPAATIAALFEKLQLEGANEAVRAAEQEGARRKHYSARSTPPDPAWRDRIRQDWSDVFVNYGYMQ